MDEKITIIEGPPPTFEAANDGWVTGLLGEPGLVRYRGHTPADIQRPGVG